MSAYRKSPAISVKGWQNAAITGWPDILHTLETEIQSAGQATYLLALDTYPGVDDQEVLRELEKLQPDKIFLSQDIFKPEAELNAQLQYNLTDDRVFGKMYFGTILDLIDQKKLEKTREQIQTSTGLILLYGFGASLLAEPDLLVCLDMARWEIQQRYRKGMPNYNCTNFDEDNLRKFKRGYFIEWRIADKHKEEIWQKIDWFLDTNKKQEPKLVPAQAVNDALAQAVSQPFRVMPYFDPGVWGGQWMKEVCGLDKSQANFAWSFDGVPEENSLLLDFGNAVVEIPALDLVRQKPKELLGPQVYARFGAEFPIRFDFLDTMDGQNLSLQVHPLTDYIHQQFGMAYTQDESYYILDAKEGAHVYLGLKDGAEPETFWPALEKANRGEASFPAEQFVNKIPAKKHDHFLIPAGTIHCSGKDAMVLEISATPYIFTFKLWDWDRLGLDGRPRPVHLEHGKHVVQWDRKTGWVMDNLVNQVRTIEETDGWKEEHTGLHELEFIETRRHWLKKPRTLQTENTVNMLNLVEGSQIRITSPTGQFEPYDVYYAETFIVPANVGEYTIEPVDGPVGVIQAYVRQL